MEVMEKRRLIERENRPVELKDRIRRIRVKRSVRSGDCCVVLKTVF